ncbi:MAG: hypothetical protein KJN85_00760 [Maribacter sp.]|nr:hypothetical protein [Maribacter sp.]
MAYFLNSSGGKPSFTAIRLLHYTYLVFTTNRIMVENKDIYKNLRFLELVREMNLPNPAPLVYDPKL